MLVSFYMIRSLVWLLAAVAFAAMMPASPTAAISSGLQYDEIVRVVVGATPPPPGSFQTDLAAIASPAPVAATAAPRRRGLGNLGALAGGILSGNVGGAVAGAATDAVVGNALDAQVDRMVAQTGSAFASAMRGLTQGRVERHSFYSGWERIDDVAGQTATITKCDLHQIIKLDLAKKTYSLSDPSAVPTEMPEPPRKSRNHERETQAKPVPEAPGTALADLRNVVTPLGARKLEGLDTAGYDDTSTFAMTQATGSCRNGNFAFHSKAYYTRLAAPRLICPLAAVPTQRYPQEPMNFVASGGCRPTFTAHKSGPAAPTQNLSLYQTIAVSGAAGPAPADATGSPASGFVFLTERGNVHTLTPASASLFEIPADFTRLP